MIQASWQRCVAKHQLSRDAARPIMRLLTSEVVPRRQSFVDRLSGNLSEIQWLSDMSRRAGHYAVVADDECVLVMRDLGQNAGSDFEQAGIVDGGCWTEQIAATNGVAMALRHRRTMTVTGADHYYALLSRFMCTATPIFDHDDQPIGAINVSAFDRGDMRDRSFAEHILRMATSRIQARLFHERFADHVRTQVLSSQGGLIDEAWNTLLAVDSDGVIRGATQAAARELGLDSALPLVGRKLDAVVGTTIDRLVGTRGQPLEVEGGSRPVTLTTVLPKPRKLALYPTVTPRETGQSRTGRITLADLEGFAEDQRALIRRTRELYRMGLPLLITGATGTGKRALVEALHFDAELGQSPLIMIDATDLGAASDALRVSHCLEHARAFGQAGADLPTATLYLKDPGAMPEAVQYQIARFLADLEAGELGDPSGPRLRVIASMNGLQEQRLLPELRSHVAGDIVRLTPLSQRSDLAMLIKRMQCRVDSRGRMISAPAMESLTKHDWPGNFRELKLVLRRASLVSAGSEIGLHDLPDRLFTALPPSTARIESRNTETERAWLEDALASTNWNMSAAARRCGISRATMHRRVTALAITRPSDGRRSVLGSRKAPH
ncbi:helix-turn-helix domain-containing protein [Blastomonas sp. CACIA14H2]|uniref:helix-turn-helix domain-containing protein n=1 Tax=Blastomonas sp. CACIA14H2 TaxID=1419876 RepID=UPI000415AB44